MIQRLLVPLFCCIAFSLSAQITPEFGDTDSHQFFVNQLNNSKDIDFQRIIGEYDQYIKLHPKEINARVERCKFIGNSYYDEYEGYNLKYEETNECIDQLYENYSSYPKVMVYKAENVYGEERLTILKEAEESINVAPESWDVMDKAAIYRMLGGWYSDEDERLSLAYYFDAQNYDEAGDYSLEIAQIFIKQDNEEAAREALLPNIEKDTSLWRMNSKANLLAQVGESEKALQLFELIAERDSTYINNQEMAKLMSEMENYEAARSFLVKDTVQEWNRETKLQKLFEHDLKHSEIETALASYRSLQENSDYDDVLGIKRLRIFFNAPLLGWTFSELFRVSLNILVLLFLFLIPYLWILPVPFIGDWLKRRKKSGNLGKLNLHWSLKHFWIISFGYLAVQYILTLVFYYEDTINSFFGSTFYEEAVGSDKLLANGLLVFVALMALTTLTVVNRQNVKQIFASNMSIGSSIGLGLAFVVFNMVILSILRSVIDFDEVNVSNLILNPRVEIDATLRTYGFFVTVLTVAIIGPVYEEIIFRGAVLGSVEKHLGFITANIFQAVMFAIVHLDLKLFIYYFIFGIITGLFARKTNGLMTGIILHALNNMFVVIVITVVG